MTVGRFDRPDMWRRAVSALRAGAAAISGDDANTSAEPAPSQRARIVAAIAIALASGTLAFYSAVRPGAVPDFLYPWTGARLFLAGQDPYAAIRAQLGGPPPYDEALFYPFTMLLALLPFAKLGLALAGAVFFGMSAGALAFFITRDAMWRLHIFASAPFVVATLLVQFSPLLLTVAFVPVLGFLATLKPNLGLAMLAYRPSRTAAGSSRWLVADPATGTC